MKIVNKSGQYMNLCLGWFKLIVHSNVGPIVILVNLMQTLILVNLLSHLMWHVTNKILDITMLAICLLQHGLGHIQLVDECQISCFANWSGWFTAQLQLTTRLYSAVITHIQNNLHDFRFRFCFKTAF